MHAMRFLHLGLLEFGSTQTVGRPTVKSSGNMSSTRQHPIIGHTTEEVEGLSGSFPSGAMLFSSTDGGLTSLIVAVLQ